MFVCIISLALLLPNWVSVSSLKLPGLCPDVPATSVLDLGHNFTTGNVILGEPFSQDRFSHLFKEIHSTVGDSFKVELFNDNNIKIKMDFQPNPTYYLKGDVILQEKTHYGVNTTIDRLDYNIADCSSVKVQEPIRIWRDGSFLIIYSCFESGADHDEAVLFIEVSKQHPDFIQNQLKETAGKYLTPQFLEAINWKSNNKGSIVKNPYDCRVDERLSVVIIALVTVGVLAVVFVPVVNFFLDKFK